MSEEPWVLWVVPKAWEEDGRLLPQHAPIPLGDWLQTLRDEGLSVRYLPDGPIIGGPWHGGHVVAVERGLAYHLFALPPAALLVLEAALPAINDRARHSLPWLAGGITARC
jgi:hypothetical protein